MFCIFLKISHSFPTYLSHSWSRYSISFLSFPSSGIYIVGSVYRFTVSLYSCKAGWCFAQPLCKYIWEYSFPNNTFSNAYSHDDETYIDFRWKVVIEILKSTQKYFKSIKRVEKLHKFLNITLSCTFMDSGSLFHEPHFFTRRWPRPFSLPLA